MGDGGVVELGVLRGTYNLTREGEPRKLATMGKEMNVL
jgi:hypothetical protein